MGTIIRLVVNSALVLALIALQIEPAAAHNGEPESPGHVLKDVAGAGFGILLALVTVLLLFWLGSELRRRMR
jgi:hypothetical protein